MNMPDSTPDDSPWSSLAEELGLDAPASRGSANRPTHTPDDEDSFGSGIEVDLSDASDHDPDNDTMIIPHLRNEPVADSDADDDGSESDDSESEESSEGTETNPGDGTRRKKRRRRRKRRGANSATDDAAPDSVDDAEASEDEEAPAAPVALDDDELPADALMREIVKTWNVPSWEEIVAGLYRPGQH